MSEILLAKRTWFLYPGKRFQVAKRTAAVVEVYSDWLEIEFEDEGGNPAEPRQFFAVQTSVFTDSIISELKQLSTKEAENRGYR